MDNKTFTVDDLFKAKQNILEIFDEILRLSHNKKELKFAYNITNAIFDELLRQLGNIKTI
ncbi:hypothetical protein [Clostridium novyi]|uniref:hypothetical protein n=1 Tax=Clostridium novyi TaxID=1542 RepID=UPI0004D6ABAD|nr:hypothetical protein [Clostridium novyi]KEH84649.1 hypothetical protein Z967_p0030 [Clostridium novyi A str. 4540]